MPKPNDFPLFEHWYRTTDWLLSRCDRMPKHTRFTISGRMANLAVHTLELILEAIYNKDRAPLLKQANMNLEKLRLFCRLCRDRQYLNPGQYEYISREINKAGLMCGGWLKTS